MKIFRDELRHARAAAGLSQEQLAEAINFSQSLVSKVENGERPPSRGFAARCDEVLGLAGLLGRLRSHLLMESAPSWLRDWMDVERDATGIRAYHPNLVIGLLQTPEYARALISADPRATPEEVDRRVTLRMERQAILDRVALVAVLDEAALRRPVAPPGVMHEQLMNLLARPIELQVIELGAHVGVNGPLMIATTDGLDVAYIEGQLGGSVIERRDDLAEIVRTWETIRGEALNRRRSRDLIKDVAEQWKP
jgi:transcriptional regulator with XRE-family HTH domain